MTEQIECVGGPLDGTDWFNCGDSFGYPVRDKVASEEFPTFPYSGSMALSEIHKEGDHIYRYDQTQSKYIYEGVQK